jgi:hypothetical protein
MDAYSSEIIAQYNEPVKRICAVKPGKANCSMQPKLEARQLSLYFATIQELIAWRTGLARLTADCRGSGRLQSGGGPGRMQVWLQAGKT